MQRKITNLSWVHGTMVSALALMVAVTSMPAQAQEVDTITVTAQKREQDLQDVPIAISAFSNEFLDNAGIDDAIELTFFTPSLTIFPAQSPVQTSINIRGVGTAGNSVSLESSVGVYVDGVYRSRQASVLNDLVDVERVELLKGPQGTLFGRNTASGALQFVTVAPTDEFEGWFEVNLGNLDFYNVKGAINIPIVEGKLATRFSGSWAEREGFVENEFTGSKLNDRNRYQIRGQALFTPTEDISFRLIADYSEIDEICCSASNIFDGPGDSTAGFQAAVAEFGFPLPDFNLFVDYETAGRLFGIDNPVILADRFNERVASMEVENFGTIEEWGISGELNWDLGWGRLTSITAYRDYEAANAADGEFTALPSFSSTTITEQTSFSQELRLAGRLFDERLDYVVGGYYFHQTLDDTTDRLIGPATNLLLAGGSTLDQFLVAIQTIPFPQACLGLNPQVVPFCGQPVFPGGSSATNMSEQEQDSWALFGQLDYRLTEKLILTGGLRYINETKDMNVQFLESDIYPGFAIFSGVSTLVPDVNGARFEDTALTYTARLSYFVTEDILTYVSYGTGYKSGGTNVERIGLTNQNQVFGAYLAGINRFPIENFVVQPETITDTLFDPETSKAWELGVKGTFLSNRLRTNVALFHTTFEDFQANSFLGGSFVLQNAGEITSQGVEVELQAAPTEWLSLFASTAYTDIVYDSFVGGVCARTPYGNAPDADEPGFPDTCDNSGNIVPPGQKWSATGSARVTLPLHEDYVGYSQLDVRWTSSIVGGNANDPNAGFDSFALVNLRAGILIMDGQYDISLWAKNLFDEDWRIGGFNGPGAREGTLVAFHTEPRTWGATLRGRF